MTDAALITATELQGDRIEDGDAAVVLKADGSFRVMQCHPEGTIDPRMLTPRQLEQGTALLAFAFLLREPEMMQIVAGMAQDRTKVNVGKLH